MNHYTEGKFISFVKKVFRDTKLDGRGNNILVVCPMCKAYKGKNYSNQKLSIKTTKPHVVHCWVCGSSAKSIHKIIKRWFPFYLDEYEKSFLNAEELLVVSSESKKKHENVKLPMGFKMLASELENCENLGVYRKKYYEECLKYLKSRGIQTKSDLWYWKFGVTLKYKEGCRDRIIIPSFDLHGNLSYWTGRSINKTSKKKYNNPLCDRKSIIFNEINIDWEEPLTLVEGPFDLMKCNQNATCLLGSELTLDYKLMQEIVKNNTPVVLALDPEKKAQQKQLKLAKRFSEFDVSVKIVEYKDKSKDIGELCQNEFNDLLSSAKPYSANYRLRRKIASII